MKAQVERLISLSLVAAMTCALMGCTYHRTVVEQPVVQPAAGDTIVVPRNSSVTVVPNN